VLREHGIAVTARGKLGAHHHEAYEKIQRGETPGAGDDTWNGPDDGDDVITGHVPGPAAGSLEDRARADEDGDTVRHDTPQEARPRVRVKQSRQSWSDRVRKATSSSKGRSKAKARPRVPVDRLITRGWSTAARFAALVSAPTARTLQLQAPVAGLILEDKARGTAADKVLQIGARAQDAGETVFALAGPPVIVLAIERAQGLPEPQRQIRLALLLPMLEEALTMWVKIGGDKVAEAAERIEADEATRAEVARLIGMIFPQAEVSDPDGEMAGAPA